MIHRRTVPRALALTLPLALLAGCGTDVSGPSSSFLSCAFGAPATLGAGEVLQFSGDGNQNVCATAAGESSAEYIYIPFHAQRFDEDRPFSLALEISAAGAAPQREAGTSRLAGLEPVLLGGRTAAGPRLVRDRAFHDWLRAREHQELGPKINAGAPSAAARVAADPPAVRLEGDGPAMDVPSVGELLDLNVSISCTEEDLRTGRVVYVSDHAVVVADTANPADLTSQDYAYFGITFDTLVYPVETAHFGVPTDIDDNDRSILFFTRAVNELNPPDATSIIIGFFWSGDLFPETDTQRLQACPAGNDAEMFYLIAPDPDGETGRRLPLDDVRELAIPLIGHEYQHLINASRRLFVNQASTFEETWLNEGLSHIAEELLFFAAADLQPGQNLGIEEVRRNQGTIDLFNEYMGGNFGNFARYLAEPDTASLMGIDDLVTRGAAWAFLRYAADRSGRGDEAFFFDVVNSTDAGLSNLAGVIDDGTPLDWMTDWTVSVYGDDFIESLAPRYTMASWDLRSLYESSTLEEYPLLVRSLNGADPATVDLLTGGAGYFRLEVGAGSPAALHVDVDGDTPPASLRGSLLRAR